MTDTKQTDPGIKMRILLAAKRLFARQGYDVTTIRQICEEAGANVALVSYYFGGKENLFASLFDTFFPSDRVSELDDMTHDPVKALTYMIREISMFRRNEPELILVLQQEIALRSPRIGHILKHTIPVWKKLRDVLETGRWQGVFRFRSLDHTLLFVIGVTLFHKQTDYFRPLFTEGEQSFEQICEDMVEFVLNALETRR